MQLESLEHRRTEENTMLAQSQESLCSELEQEQEDLAATSLNEHSR